MLASYLKSLKNRLKAHEEIDFRAKLRLLLDKTKSKLEEDIDGFFEGQFSFTLYGGAFGSHKSLPKTFRLEYWVKLDEENIIKGENKFILEDFERYRCEDSFNLHTIFINVNDSSFEVATKISDLILYEQTFFAIHGLR